MNEATDTSLYILRLYKLFTDNSERIYFISYLKKCEEITNCEYVNKSYAILKSNEICIKQIIKKHATILHNNIINNGGYDSWYMVEICRCICTSIPNAKTISNSQIEIATKHEGKMYKFYCECCNYSSDLESKWIRHQIGKKHLEKANINNDGNIKKTYICRLCKNVYLSRTSLWKHKKECDSNTSKCTNMNTCHYFIDVDKPYGMQNEVMEIIQQNQLLIAQNEEFKELLMEQHDKMMELSVIPRHTTINNNNSNHFNLNFFLNETCKDAMSLTQFVNSLQIDTATLEYTGVNGYVAGISKIFTDGLRQLEMTMRPIHCTDLKRETLYIKENDVWEKDNDEKTKFNNALKAVVRRNMQQVREWVDINPRCDIIDSREYQLHIDIMKQCVGGSCEYTNNRKILRNVAKEVFIDKTKM